MYMVQDLFSRLQTNMGPLGQHMDEADGYYMFPKLEGEISSRMSFRGKKMISWSLNNYLGLGNHPEVRKADADAAIVVPNHTVRARRLWVERRTGESDAKGRSVRRGADRGRRVAPGLEQVAQLLHG